MASKVPLRQVSVLLIMTAMSACTVTTTENGSPAPGTGGTGTCSPDSTVVGCVGAAAGYSCSGTDSPDAIHSALTCSDGTASNNGVTLYCCVETTTVAAGCTADSSIVGCKGSSIGFSCTGTTSPDQGDPSLVCSAGTASGSASLFCCASYTPSIGTCAQDATVQGCPSPSIGFSCSGSDSPQMVNPIARLRRGRARRRGHRVLLRDGQQHDADDDGHVRGRRGSDLHRAGHRVLVHRRRRADAK